jgi:hypothetical protein
MSFLSVSVWNTQQTKAANFFSAVLVVPSGECTQCHIQEKTSCISATAGILFFQLVVCYRHFPFCFAFSISVIIILHICFKLRCQLSKLFRITLKQRNIKSGTGWTVSWKIHPLVSTYTGQWNKEHDWEEYFFLEYTRTRTKYFENRRSGPPLTCIPHIVE